MKSLHESRIMLCQPFFSRYSGSEVITLELAEALSDAGARVTIATWLASSQMQAELANVPNVEVAEINSPAFAGNCQTYPPDLVWVNQGLVPAELMSIETRFIFTHLSSFNSFEFPFCPAVENSLASLVFFVSEETKNEQLGTGMYDQLPKETHRLLENPAPNAFHQNNPVEYKGNPPHLNSLLVVSNHLPDEVYKALNLLKSAGVESKVIGLSREEHDHEQVRVDANLINQFDAVMTIGKTVQYALCSGRPVFCYDHFGGPGWLSEGNYEKARYHNFSGRGFDKASPQKIAEHIQTGFPASYYFTRAHIDEFRLSYGYSRILDEIEQTINSDRPRRATAEPSDILGFLKAHETVGGFGRSYYSVQDQLDRPDVERDRLKHSVWLREERASEAETRCLELQATLAEMSQETKSLTKRAELAENSLADFKQSRSWRITKPLRSVTDSFRQLRRR